MWNCDEDLSDDGIEVIDGDEDVDGDHEGIGDDKDVDDDDEGIDRDDEGIDDDEDVDGDDDDDIYPHLITVVHPETLGYNHDMKKMLMELNMMMMMVKMTTHLLALIGKNLPVLFFVSK